MADNKRQYDRFAADLEVRFEHKGAAVTARSRDISVGGMFVLTDRALPYGTTLTIEVKLPALATPARIDVTVRWTGSDGMGLQFAGLRARETWAINQLIRG